MFEIRWCLYFFVILLNCSVFVFGQDAKIENTTSNTTQQVAEAKSDNVTTLNLVENVNKTAQTQQIERTLGPITETNLTAGPFGAINATNKKDFSDFRPSPHLETYYEFNKFPVTPALPEAKTIRTRLNFGEIGGERQEKVNWPDKVVAPNEPPWTAKVRFPTTGNNGPLTSKDRPYQFYTSPDRSQLPSKLDNDLGLTKPYLPPDLGNNWDKYERKRPQFHKNQFDFQAPIPVHKPPNHHHQHEEYEIVERHPPENPWKKIIKFLTAFIPIGLLISALTPTVITVTPVNGTQFRSRVEDPQNQRAKKLISSLDYFSKLNNHGCEDRILCELLVSASGSKNAEEHVENLLNAFTEDGKVVERAEEMKTVFEAVKKGDCRPIICNNIKEKT